VRQREGDAQNMTKALEESDRRSVNVCGLSPVSRAGDGVDTRPRAHARGFTLSPVFDGFNTAFIFQTPLLLGAVQRFRSPVGTKVSDGQTFVPTGL